MRHNCAILFYLFVKTLSNICIHISNHHSNYVVKTQTGVIVSNVLFLFSLTFLSRIFVNSISECPKTSISNPVISSNNNNNKIINSCSHTTETEVVVWKCVFFFEGKAKKEALKEDIRCSVCYWGIELIKYSRNHNKNRWPRLAPEQQRLSTPRRQRRSSVSDIDRECRRQCEGERGHCQRETGTGTRGGVSGVAVSSATEPFRNLDGCTYPYLVCCSKYGS